MLQRFFSNQYRFVTEWIVEADVREVAAIIGDASGYSRWWPSVYLAADIIKDGDESGVGEEAELVTKGWLPTTLHWRATIIENRKPNGFTIRAQGDFEGEGVWQFRQNGGNVHVMFDWRIQVHKPMIRKLTFLLRPVFAANYTWAMKRGLESLRIELARRRAKTQEELNALPKPPRPTFRFSLFK